VKFLIVLGVCGYDIGTKMCIIHDCCLGPALVCCVHLPSSSPTDWDCHTDRNHSGPSVHSEGGTRDVGGDAGDPWEICWKKNTVPSHRYGRDWGVCIAIGCCSFALSVSLPGIEATSLLDCLLREWSLMGYWIQCPWISLLGLTH